MTRKFKILGLALTAVVAATVLSATNASAAGESFHSESEKTILTGTSESNQAVTASGFSVECTDAVYVGTLVGRSTKTTTLHPAYTGCTSSLGNAPIDTTGCNYVFGSETTGTGHLPASIDCTAGSAIKVTAPGCTLSFGTQTGGGGVVVTNMGSGTTADVTYHTTFSGTFSKSGFGCFVISGTTATYTGPITLKGFLDNGTTGNIDEGATYTEGAQVGITWN